jgi:hypothetical protein
MQELATTRLDRCPFCEHDNPSDSKFCNACGAPVNLVPCPKCGAVNDVKASSCYECRSLMAGGVAKAPDTAPTIASGAESLPRRNRRTAGVALVAMAVVLLGYLGYRQWSVVEPPPAVKSEPSGRAAASRTGVITRDASPIVNTPAKVAEPPTPVPPTTVPAETPPIDTAETTASRPRAGKSARQEPRREACTEALAALGLCTIRGMAASGALALPSEGAGTTGKAPPLPEACTEAIAALGLCTPGPTPRRE